MMWTIFWRRLCTLSMYHNIMDSQMSKEYAGVSMSSQLLVGNKWNKSWGKCGRWTDMMWTIKFVTFFLIISICILYSNFWVPLQMYCVFIVYVERYKGKTYLMPIMLTKYYVCILIDPPVPPIMLLLSHYYIRIDIYIYDMSICISCVSIQWTVLPLLPFKYIFFCIWSVYVHSMDTY